MDSAIRAYNRREGEITMRESAQERQRSAKGDRKENKSRNIRVYELAKQYDLTNKELIALLEEHGVRVKSGMSGLDPDTVALIESELVDELVEDEDTVSTTEDSVEDISKVETDMTDGLQIPEGTNCC